MKVQLEGLGSLDMFASTTLCIVSGERAVPLRGVIAKASS